MLTFLLFVVCMVVLGLIFLPKMLMQHRYGKMSVAEQTKAMTVSVRLSARMHGSAPGLGSTAFRKAGNDITSNGTSNQQQLNSHMPRLQKVDEGGPAMEQHNGNLHSDSTKDEPRTAAGEDKKPGTPPDGSTPQDGTLFVAKPEGRLLYSSYIEDETYEA
jgi:hypothetical protein